LLDCRNVALDNARRLALEVAGANDLALEVAGANDGEGSPRPAH